MPGKLQEYGRDYKTLCITVSPEEHKQYRLKSIEYDVSIADVARAALADDKLWRRVAAEKQKAKG